jgi:branched-chain amino acid transport system substrate-binding protein
LFKPDFGPTAAEFTQKFQAKYNIEPGYHAAGGYAAGLLLAHAIGEARSIEQAKVADVLNRLDVTTMFGRTKFSTNPKEHGLQMGHEMVIAQWQKRAGKLFKEVIWPKSAKTADTIY